MDELTRNRVAESLERLADQAVWNPELRRQTHELVQANWENELLRYVYDDIVHYSGEFHSYNLLGIRTKPDRYQLEQYRQEFRDVASALRSSLSLNDAKKKYGL